MSRVCVLQTLGLVIILTGSPISASEVITANGTTTISSTMINGDPIIIGISSMMLDTNYPYKGAFMWGGDMKGDGSIRLPKTVIASMSVRIGKRNIIVPLSAYSDLGDPRRISLDVIPQGSMLTIWGGEDEMGRTSRAYKVVLEYSYEGILSRKVYFSLNPSEVWDETIYHRDWND